MRLQTIKINDHGDRQFIGLTGIDDPRTLTIVIGYNEALAIDRFVKETRPPRPLTHELISNLVQASGCKVERVDITELRNGTFYAMIRLEQPDGNIIEVDARPSDAVALATALEAPIFVAEDVVDEATSLS